MVITGCWYGQQWSVLQLNTHPVLIIYRNHRERKSIFRCSLLSLCTLRPTVWVRALNIAVIFPQRSLLMKKQQKKRTDTQMVVANQDARQKKKNRKPRAAHSDETPLLISQSLSNTSLSGKYHKICLFYAIEMNEIQFLKSPMCNV